MEKKNFLEYKPNFSYKQALRYQEYLNGEGHTGLFSFSCSPTITLGRASNIKEECPSATLLKERQFTILETNRGGKATYHGPEQLIGFPLGNLEQIYKDGRAVRQFVEELLLGLAHACATLGVKGVEIKKNFPGLWTANGKLASVGIAIKGGYVSHGFSLNVGDDLESFMVIDPCGIKDCPITSLENEGVKVHSKKDLAATIAPYLSNLFSLGTGTVNAIGFKEHYKKPFNTNLLGLE